MIKYIIGQLFCKDRDAKAKEMGLVLCIIRQFPTTGLWRTKDENNEVCLYFEVLFCYHYKQIINMEYCLSY